MKLTPRFDSEIDSLPFVADTACLVDICHYLKRNYFSRREFFLQLPVVSGWISFKSKSRTLVRPCKGPLTL
jgi:hypothetical protein